MFLDTACKTLRNTTIAWYFQSVKLTICEQFTIIYWINLVFHYFSGWKCHKSIQYMSRHWRSTSTLLFPGDCQLNLGELLSDPTMTKMLMGGGTGGMGGIGGLGGLGGGLGGNELISYQAIFQLTYQDSYSNYITGQLMLWFFFNIGQLYSRKILRKHNLHVASVWIVFQDV